MGDKQGFPIALWKPSGEATTKKEGADMEREYIGRATINGLERTLKGTDRGAVMWALRAVTETAEQLGWRVQDTSITTRMRSSITGEYMGEATMRI